MTGGERRQFERQLAAVMGALPGHIHTLLEEVPLIVEDYPADDVLDEMGCEYIDDLCGLHSGIPLTERSVESIAELPPQICIYREGILSAASREDGSIDDAELERQIRITILHEIGHHFGLDEEDLRKLGYE